MQDLLNKIKACEVCSAHLEFGPRPIIAASKHSKLVVIGQAPGAVVHRTGIPWDDKSGENLRNWLGIAPETFYNAKKVALIPMGFCYPGKGKSGDLPPRKECAPLWHGPVLEQLNPEALVLLIGQYAQKYYLQSTMQPTLTKTVKCFNNYLPKYFVLPHPSPRNNIWMAKNPWFAKEVLPQLKSSVQALALD